MNVNDSTRDNDTSIRPKPIPLYAEIILSSILLVWSLVGNILVIAVVYCNQNLRTNMNYLIVNMAVSDLLIPLVAVPLSVSRNMTNGEWLVDGPLGEPLCKLVPFLSELSPFVSSISLVIIAFQRFMAVVYPHRGEILSRKTRWFVISFPWIVAMALHSPYFYIFHLTIEDGYTMCEISWSPTFDHWTAEVIWTSTATAVGFVIPLIVTIIMYSMVVHKLRQNLNNVRDMLEKERIRLRQTRNRRIFGMLMTIVVLFTTCWCPFLVLALLNIIAPSLLSMDISSLYTMHLFFSFMWYLLATVNPCIYFAFLKDFRQGLKRLCCRRTAPAIEPITRPPRTPEVEIVTRTQHVHHLTSIPLQSRMNINTRRPRTPGGDSNQDQTCTPPHINTTSV